MKNYFVGKICTIFTVPINRNFKEENPASFPQPVFQYFVGKVLEITSQGVLIEQWNSNKKLKSFFFSDKIVSIVEEEILDPQDPQDKQMINDYIKNKQEATEAAQKQYEKLKEHAKNEQEYVDLPESVFDIEKLSKISENIKKNS